ncbi:MAG: hypothetical protein SPD88_05550, partial [Candidatus Ventricola sp.]|nr:hypothetical protein [Candidatus Ventricola sp.]
MEKNPPLTPETRRIFHSAALFGKGGAKTRQESFLRCRMIIRLVKNVFGRGISVTEDMMET